MGRSATVLRMCPSATTKDIAHDASAEHPEADIGPMFARCWTTFVRSALGCLQKSAFAPWLEAGVLWKFTIKIGVSLKFC